MPDAQATTRETILDTALGLFLAQGYDSTSLRQIADRLGFTKAALYYHFPAKDLLLVELTRPWLDAVSRLVSLHEEDASEADPCGRRTRVLADYVDLLAEHHRVLGLLSQDPGAARHPDVGSRARALVTALKDQLVGPDADDEERIRVTCALGAVHAVLSLEPTTFPTARPIVLEAALAALGRSPRGE